ncbi:F510_1955 family glycosylhydrolase [Chlorogloeopsis sp. ULAP02]|uniref:F510_1955 family glycosylhydrolase n=1 Tax=Chlorogloeopsis sp. ULAP02 TaxID=3107926 RepID=UPI003136A5E1
MSQPDSKDYNMMKWMGIAMVACCAIPIAFFLFLGGGLGVWFGRSIQQPTSNQSTNQPNNQAQPKAVNVFLEKAVNWQVNNHVHGLTVNRDNPNIIYVASHNGLLQRSETGEWFWMGKERADYMGFTADPINSKRFYSSGHPHTGGNLGFQISENQGQDWKQISMPGVDFHAIAIAPSNPNVFYGWPASGAQGLHTSNDRGKTWVKTRMTGLGDAPFDLAVDPQNPKHLFATTRSGMYESTNSGNDWTLVPSTREVPVISLALQKEGNNLIMYGYRFLKSAPGIYRSSNGGKTWAKLWTETNGVVVKLAIAPSNPRIFYTVNDNNAVFQSQNSGKTWIELK